MTAFPHKRHSGCGRAAEDGPPEYPRCRPMFFALLALCLAPLLHAAIPARIVSINLCTDELLLQLAAPEQIASVTWLVQDPELSSMAEAAAAFPANRGSAEEVMSFRPDLVLAGRYGAKTAVQMLRQLHLRVEVLDVPTSLEEAMAELGRFSQILGRQKTGQQLLAAMQQRLDETGPFPHEQRPLAVVFLPNGYTSGRGSLLQDLLDFAGLDNLALQKGYAQYLFLPLEVLLHGRPDLLIVDEMSRVPSLAHELLQHPALRSRAGFTPARLQLPSRRWTCGMPEIAEVAASLRRAALGALQQAAGQGP